MTELTDFRTSKDEYMGHEHHSPLTHEQLESFSGLSYYDESSDLKLELKVEEFEDREVVEMQTSTGDVASYVRLGRIHFGVDGEDFTRTFFLAVCRRHQRGRNLWGGTLPGCARASGRQGPGRLQLRLQPVLCLQRGVELPDNAVREPAPGAHSCRREEFQVEYDTQRRSEESGVVRWFDKLRSGSGSSTPRTDHGGNPLPRPFAPLRVTDCGRPLVQNS